MTTDTTCSSNRKNPMSSFGNDYSNALVTPTRMIGESSGWIRAAALVVIAFLTQLVSVQAQYQWKTNATNSILTNAANWTNGTSPVTGATLSFSNSTITNINLSANFTVGGMTFNSTANGYTFTSNTFTVNAGNYSNNSLFAVTFNSQMAHNADNVNYNTTNGGGNFIFNSVVYGNQIVNIGGSGDIIFTTNSQIQQGTFRLNGSGNVYVNGVVTNRSGFNPSFANSGTGTLFLNSNTISSAVVTVNNGAIVENGSSTGGRSIYGGTYIANGSNPLANVTNFASFYGRSSLLAGNGTVGVFLYSRRVVE